MTKRPGPSSAGASRPRTRARRGEGDRLRDEILDAAEALLHETGSADKVSTRAVATRVGVSSPSIYLHFPDRAALLFAVCQRQFDTLGARLAEVAVQVDDPVERVIAIGREYCHFALEHPQQYRTMTMDVISGAAYEAELDEMRSETGFDVLYAAVIDGVDAGVFVAADPIASAFGLWCAAHGLVSLMIAKPNMGWPRDDTLVDSTLHQVIDGIRARPVATLAVSRKPASKQATSKKATSKKATSKKAISQNTAARKAPVPKPTGSKPTGSKRAGSSKPTSASKAAGRPRG